MVRVVIIMKLCLMVNCHAIVKKKLSWTHFCSNSGFKKSLFVSFSNQYYLFFAYNNLGWPNICNILTFKWRQFHFWMNCPLNNGTSQRFLCPVQCDLYLIGVFVGNIGHLHLFGEDNTTEFHLHLQKYCERLVPIIIHRLGWRDVY